MLGIRQIPFAHQFDSTPRTDHSLSTSRARIPNRGDRAGKGWKGNLWIGLQIGGFALLMWATARVCRLFGATRSTAAMLLLLEVLGIATLGDPILALISSAIASFTLSRYLSEPIGSLHLTTARDGVSFAAMALTALIVSQLSIRTQRRMREAIDRREEMERLHQFGSVLIAANTMAEAAENAVSKAVELFGLKGAALHIEGIARPFQWGTMTGDRVATVPLDAGSRAGVLELCGARLSDEVASALASMICLVLERARSAEERAELEATRRGEELRSTVLNALAHDFRTPLTSIKAAASTLRASGEPRLTGERELIAVIDEEADRLNQLIRESLELAKLEGSRINPRNEDCEISRVVDRVVARIERFLGSRELILEVPNDLPPIAGDSFLLEQMLLQVVDNAWKYSRPGTPIRISAALAGPNLVLTVRSEGGEIPESERERIFEKFYRGSRDRFAVEGTGLGLVIAKTIAESHGGRIWLDNEPQGPAFCFAFPVEGAKRLHDREMHHITR